MVSCIVWAAFGFLYYGVILLSAKVMEDSGGCSFDYSILFFASSRCVRACVRVWLLGIFVSFLGFVLAGCAGLCRVVCCVFAVLCCAVLVVLAFALFLVALLCFASLGVALLGCRFASRRLACFA